jgi:hypothetical protein
MNIQPHTFLFNFQKRLDTFIKDQPQLSTEYSFMPVKTIFNKVGTSFKYFKVDNFLAKNIDFSNPTDVPQQLQKLIDSIIYSTAAFKFNFLDEQSSLTNFYTNYSIGVEGLSTFHILFDFYSGVMVKTPNEKVWITFSVDASNNLSSLYLIFQ